MLKEIGLINRFLQTTGPKQPCADFYSAVKKAAGKAKKTSGNMKKQTG
jgi:hypothetical protein